jgi:hypothetical protein
MDIETITPTSLSKPVLGLARPAPAYNPASQLRFSAADGTWTYNSRQTFGSDGQPKDAESDHND